MLAFSSKPNLTLVDQSLHRQRSYICRGRESPLQMYGIEKIALDQVARLEYEVGLVVTCLLHLCEFSKLKFGKFEPLSLGSRT